MIRFRDYIAPQCRRAGELGLPGATRCRRCSCKAICRLVYSTLDLTCWLVCQRYPTGTCVSRKEGVRSSRNNVASSFGMATPDVSPARDSQQQRGREPGLCGTVNSGEALVNLNYLRMAGSAAKTAHAISMANEIYEQDIQEAAEAAAEGRAHKPAQIVIFTAFVESARRIAAALNCGVISGDTKDTKRQQYIDDFQANRAPDKAYRTAPLAALFTPPKGGYFHAGRLATSSSARNWKPAWCGSPSSVTLPRTLRSRVDHSSSVPPARSASVTATAERRRVWP